MESDVSACHTRSTNVRHVAFYRGVTGELERNSLYALKP